MLKEKAAGAGWDRLRNWFPDREFFMRSQGQVRFLKISSRMQIGAAIAVLVLLLGWAISMAVMGWINYQAQADRVSLLEDQARVASAEERIDAYGDDIKAVGEDLSKRMEFLERMNETLPEDMKVSEGSDTVSNSDSETAKTVEKVSASFPHAAQLAKIEARQIAYVEKLTRYADARAARAVKAMRKLRIDPKDVLQEATLGAMGGPLELLATNKDGSIDPRFERLGLSLARMTALERGLNSIPQTMPASLSATKLSSGFGYRRDPFNGRGAMHSGMDFKGPVGSPIYAAAQGTVSFVGWKSGYGKVVEIDHGSGIMTRYAHLSGFHAKEGQQVASGAHIGALGNTGRSTGPHLHFEVRINNRAVNPRPFLERASNVLKEARRNSSANAGSK